MRIMAFFSFIIGVLGFVSVIAMPAAYGSSTPHLCPSPQAWHEQSVGQGKYYWVLDSADQSKGWVSYRHPYNKDTLIGFHVVYLNDLDAKPRYGASIICYYVTSDGENVIASFSGVTFSHAYLDNVVNINSRFKHTNLGTQIACGFVGTTVNSCQWTHVNA